MSGTVDSIYLAGTHGGTQRRVGVASLTTGLGLEGDRHASANGGVVSLIEVDAVVQFNDRTGLSIGAADTG
ncbi:MAG: hypothetical protein O7B25_08330, partial [Gammaproteobacteria bacterium]|nr:hypothetical protein [Gammaproteobacteria bacterium]